MERPTPEGRKRYWPDGLYKGPFPGDPAFWEACTCNPGCPDPCAGQCGCEACETARDDTIYLEGLNALNLNAVDPE
jgi:hypothetical protein